MTLSLITKCVQFMHEFQRHKIAIILIEEEFLFHMIYDDTYPSIELVYDIIRVEKVSTFFFC